MSDLEDWLKEEVFCTDDITPEVVELFERWREDLETNIESWLDSDDGDGNSLSWREWGRGFGVISDEDEDDFDEMVQRGKELLIIQSR